MTTDSEMYVLDLNNEHYYYICTTVPETMVSLWFSTKFTCVIRAYKLLWNLILQIVWNNSQLLKAMCLNIFDLAAFFLWN